MPRSALAVETHENWLEQHRYLHMDELRAQKKKGCVMALCSAPLGSFRFRLGNQPLGELGV